MSDRDTTPPTGPEGDERMLALLRGEIDGVALDALLNDVENDPATARSLADWQTLATLAVDEHVDATRASAFATFESSLAAARQAREPKGESSRDTSARTEEARPAATRQPDMRPTPPKGWTDRVKHAWHAWLAGGTAGLRPALVALALAQAGVIGLLIDQRDAALVDHSTVWRGGGNPCEQATVSLAPDASVDDLMQWLGLHGATMQGPDANGRFTLVTSDPAALRALMADPAAGRLVRAREPVPAACGASR
jgi:hypothetical protein